MSYTAKVFMWTFVLIIIAAGLSWWLFVKEDQQRADAGSSKYVTFVCMGSDSIQANFNDQSVNLKLSDGRSMMLKHAVSASGARYTNDDERIVFWNKGNTSFITEGDSMTYNNCVRRGEDDLVNLEVYDADGFQFRYPSVMKRYKENRSDTSGWSYISTQTGDLAVQMKLDTTIQSKTNLSEATFSVGKSNNVANCLKPPEAPMVKVDSIRRSSITFVKSEYEEAGAGNFYQVRRFRTRHQDVCYSIEEMVHSTNIHNYPPERGIAEYDSARVWKALDVAWQTFYFK